MRLLIATDAWEPQINGVVRTLQATIASLARFGVETVVIDPSRFRTLPLPSYPDIRLALTGARAMARLVEDVRPDAIHIATEGPIGLAMRKACLTAKRRFTSSYHTRFPEYLQARTGWPPGLCYGLLRSFHAPSAQVLVSTQRLRDELQGRGFGKLGHWPRGVDTELFRPDDAARLDLPRPIFLSVGRLAIEKNLAAFLELDLPGSKVVVGDGPQSTELKLRFPKAHFLGSHTGKALAEIYAAADVFVFPSLTDTYGIVLLEAAASGLPIAAFPVPGPLDVVGGSGVAVLDPDLRQACMGALRLSRAACRDFALSRSWEEATRQFIAAVMPDIMSRRSAA